MNSIQFEIPRSAIEEIAREVCGSMIAAPRLDAEAQNIKLATERILAKPFITIAEAEFLLNCSRGYIGGLIEKAYSGTTAHPIPYCDLDGLIVFEPSSLMEWARTRKPLQKGKRKQGGKKPQRHLREIKQAANG